MCLYLNIICLVMIIECQNLDQSYGAKQVLTGVSLSIESGCTGLLGPNGAGKSTLIKSMLAQLKIPIGRIRVMNMDPATDPLLVRQMVGYMPEKDVYLPGMNGFELCAFCGELSGMRRNDAVGRAHEVLFYVGLGEARYREVDGYSTGMRQRLKLASALVHGPKLLILDEPTTGLDPRGREEMLELVNDVTHERGIDVLMSSHILRDIEQTSDNIVVLNEGRVLFSGARKNFQHQESRMLKVRVKEGNEKMHDALQRSGCRIVSTIGAANLEVELPEKESVDLVWKIAKQENLQIRTLIPATISLEQAFEKVLGGSDSLERH